MTAHSRWLISSIPFVSCSDRCPVNPLSPSPPSRLACTGPRTFSVVKSVLLSLCYHDWKKCNVSYCICCAPTVGNVLDFLRQLLQPLALCPIHLHDELSHCLGTHALDDIRVSIPAVAHAYQPYLVAFRLDWESTPWCLPFRNHDCIPSLPLPSYLAKRLCHLSATGSAPCLSRQLSCYALCSHYKGATLFPRSALSRRLCQGLGVPCLSLPLSYYTL